MRSVRRLPLVLCTVVVLVSAPGCDRAPAPPKADVVVDLKDFEVGLSTARTGSGRVVFDLENSGPTVHELVVARTDLDSGDLPLGADGLSVAAHQLESLRQSLRAGAIKPQIAQRRESRDVAGSAGETALDRDESHGL